MIFICTCSQDVTTDMLLPFLKSTPFFRFNIDRPDDYIWDFSKGGFAVSSTRTQLSINQDSLSAFYLRKPIHFDAIDIPREGCLENWCREETDALFEDFYRDCEERGLTVLVHSRSRQYGKLRQMRSAAKYFRVADWHVFHGRLPSELTRGKWVAKALVDAPIGKGKAFFVKEVDPAKLDLSYPWFLQEKVDGDDEVTVVYVDGKLFAYRFPRDAIKDSADVRKATFESPSKWEPCSLSSAEQTAICGFMAETGYRFGRFDFIRKDDELWFLELNPNGQWAWLDEDNEDGLISSIADAIIASDESNRRLGRRSESAR